MSDTVYTPQRLDQLAVCFLNFRRRAKRLKEVTIKWCPGHEGIKGNERADELAKKGQSAELDLRVGPTHAGTKSEERQALRSTARLLWEKRAGLLKHYYNTGA